MCPLGRLGDLTLPGRCLLHPFPGQTLPPMLDFMKQTEVKNSKFSFHLSERAGRLCSRFSFPYMIFLPFWLNTCEETGVCVCVRTHTRACLSVCVYVCVCVCLCVPLSLYASVCPCVCLCVHTRSCLCASVEVGDLRKSWAGKLCASFACVGYWCEQDLESVLHMFGLLKEPFSFTSCGPSGILGHRCHSVFHLEVLMRKSGAACLGNGVIRVVT